MKRYWIKFDLSMCQNVPFGLQMGCGITAFDLSDAISIAKKMIFKDEDVPPILDFTENVDLSKLDQNHVIPNMEPPNNRGVWFH